MMNASNERQLPAKYPDAVTEGGAKLPMEDTMSGSPGASPAGTERPETDQDPRGRGRRFGIRGDHRNAFRGVSASPHRNIESVVFPKTSGTSDQDPAASSRKGDPEIEEAFERIRMLTGTTIQMRLSRRDDEGRWAFITGSLRFNPEKEDPQAIEERIAKAYGPGDYLVVYNPPRGSRIKPISVELTIAEQPGKGFRTDTPGRAVEGYPGVLTDLARSLEILNNPQNRANADIRQVAENLTSLVRELMRKQVSADRYDRRQEEPAPYEYAPEDPEIKGLKDSVSRNERILEKLLESQMSRKDDGGMDKAIKALGETMTAIMGPMMAAMRPASGAQGTTVSEVLQVITALKGRDDAPRDPNAKLLETVLTLVGSQGRDQLDMLLRGYDMGKKGEISPGALSDLRDENPSGGIGEKLIGLGEKFAVALGTSVGSKIGEAATNIATTGSAAPVRAPIAEIPAVGFPVPRIRPDQGAVRRPQPVPTAPTAAPRAPDQTPVSPVAPPPRSSEHQVADGSRPAKFPKPMQGEHVPSAATIPADLSQAFINALRSDESPESIAAQTVMMIKSIASSSPDAAPAMEAFVESFNHPLDEGLAKLKPVLVPAHFDEMVSMMPKVERTYAEIRKLVAPKVSG